MVSGLPVSIAASKRAAVSDPNARSDRDLLRLERAVKALAAEHASLAEEYASLAQERDALARKLDETAEHGRGLEARLLAENQRRQDALKRIDELIGRFEATAVGAVAPGR
jgi:DNA repair exonuclease SbcCD ATPase subunit